ncbi:uncharacterized protein LOC132304123 [Cornus florida]|uniref:uncharacterized protein LOC132304123 n=1 Tax=Cornus florida TaxID=4283 RepID=UPI00289E1E70|nr:uncharacterized protein LOC132304123 [Cornus florida]XP_059657657.1 uncharacterized protein LOC132304123 [Cornus florida]XP_059657658.1 uncharacterized protein LOC132304123 [Cornus florida]
MVSLSNGGLPDGNPNKRPIPAGGGSSSGVVLPKYKPRRVSCVRDFPPMCGPNAPGINLRPRETGVALVSDEKISVGGESKVGVVETYCDKTAEVGDRSESHELVKSLVKLETLESVDDLVGKVVSADGMVHGDDKLSPKVDSLRTGLEKDSEDPSEVSKESHEVQVQIKVENVGALENEPALEIGAPADGVVPVGSAKLRSAPKWSEAAVLKAKYRPRRVSATRDFPAFCGINAPAPTEEERSRILSANRSLGAEKTGVEDGPSSETARTAVEDGPPVETMRTSLEEAERNVQDRNAQKKELKGIASEHRNKSETVNRPSRETVRTAVEDGPPIETMRASLEEGERNVQDRNAQKKELKGIDPRNKSQTVNRPSREAVRTAVEDRPPAETMGSSLEEAERNVQNRNAQKKELKGIVSEPRNESQTVNEESKADVRGSTGKGGLEMVVYSHDRSLKRMPLGDPVGLGYDADRVIVQCLMAAPNCPWRQGRGASKISSAEGVSESKEKKHDFTPREKSKRVSRTKNHKADYSGEKSMEEESLSAGKMDFEGIESESKEKKHDFTPREKSKGVSRKKNHKADYLGEKSMKEESVSAGKTAFEGIDVPIDEDEEDSVAHDEELHKSSPAGKRLHTFDVSLPPFGPNSSSYGDARNKVRETLRLFQAICRKLLQGEEAKLRQGGYTKLRQGGDTKSKQKGPTRIDLEAAKIVRDKGKEVNTGKQILGPVPGVEVGDEFQYRVELALIGVHRLYQAGIDYIKQGKDIIATSIVASGGYADDLDNADVLIYSGQGGNPSGPDKKAEDQKLERGNLALKNSISSQNPVRVIRGFKETKASNSDARAKIVATYTYDGLYTVQRYWQEPGQHGKLVFKFVLHRNPGQPELAWKEVKKSKKFKIREGLCVDDISEGKELFPICAVNPIDNEKPPPFNYIEQMIYPVWYRPIPPKGCDCIDGCSDSKKCSCVVKNGGEIPYNHNGAIVEVKPLVYECGPSCKCPPSCYNRVSQNGIKIQLEIFKTLSRGWGVRSLTSISSGSFICEYVGELLEDKEAEQRTGNDEYLFDIGQNYSDCSLGDGLRTLKPDAQSGSSVVMEEGGYTIDAAQYGNIGRFINHSCSPNLYAQNVIYDHDDTRMPHIMFFAAENIPPLQELTYHYNYSIDQVHDSNGNIKIKRCYCGSTECTGRMY